MRAITLIALCLLIWLSGFCQPEIPFSRLYNFSDTVGYGNTANNVLPYDSFFIISGTTHTKEYPGQALFFAKLNYAGDTLWHRIIGKPHHRFYTQSPGTFIRLKDGNLLQSGADENIDIKDTAMYHSPYLLKLKPDGDTLFLKIYKKEIRRYLYEIFELEDGSILGVGTSSDSVLKDNGQGIMIPAYWYNYVVKYTSDGDEVWEKTFNKTPVDKSTYLFSAVQARDGSYILAGSETTNSVGPYPRINPVFMKMDTLGNILWKKIYGSQEYSNPNLEFSYVLYDLDTKFG
ncbi:MAG: hypothetical protein WD077_08590, partial [Bacteroidia bacterium]